MQSPTTPSYSTESSSHPRLPQEDLERFASMIYLTASRPSSWTTFYDLANSGDDWIGEDIDSGFFSECCVRVREDYRPNIQVHKVTSQYRAGPPYKMAEAGPARIICSKKETGREWREILTLLATLKTHEVEVGMRFMQIGFFDKDAVDHVRAYWGSLRQWKEAHNGNLPLMPPDNAGRREPYDPAIRCSASWTVTNNWKGCPHVTLVCTRIPQILSIMWEDRHPQPAATRRDA